MFFDNKQPNLGIPGLFYELMKMQEEKIRQTMEELAVTQDELRRREETYIARIEELESKVKW